MKNQLSLAKEEQVIFFTGDAERLEKDGFFRYFVILTTKRLIFFRYNLSLNPCPIHYIKLCDVLNDDNGQPMVKTVNDKNTPYNCDMIEIAHANGKEVFKVYLSLRPLNFSQEITRAVMNLTCE